MYMYIYFFKSNCQNYFFNLWLALFSMHFCIGRSMRRMKYWVMRCHVFSICANNSLTRASSIWFFLTTASYACNFSLVDSAVQRLFLLLKAFDSSPACRTGRGGRQSLSVCGVGLSWAFGFAGCGFCWVGWDVGGSSCCGWRWAVVAAVCLCLRMRMSLALWTDFALWRCTLAYFCVSLLQWDDVCRLSGLSSVWCWSSAGVVWR